MSPAILSLSSYPQEICMNLPHCESYCARTPVAFISPSLEALRRLIRVAGIMMTFSLLALIQGCKGA